MDALEHIPERYSAVINLWLDCAQGRFPLAQVGNTFVISDLPLNLPGGEASVSVSIDGQVFTRQVLFSGMRDDAREALISPRDGLPF